MRLAVSMTVSSVERCTKPSRSWNNGEPTSFELVPIPQKKPRDRESHSLVQANKAEQKDYLPRTFIINSDCVAWSHQAVNQRVKRFFYLRGTSQLAPLAPRGSRASPSMGPPDDPTTTVFSLRLGPQPRSTPLRLLRLYRVAHLPLTRQWSTL